MSSSYAAITVRPISSSSAIWAGLNRNDALDSFDVAIVDLMLSGVSALPFAERLRDRNRPFVFTSGFGDMRGRPGAFPGVRAVGKPYSGTDLIEAVAAAAGRL